MRFSTPLIPGFFLRRYKRFIADVQLADGRVVAAHCTNTGRMTGCSEPGSYVYISASANPGRKLAYTLELVQTGDTWIGVNTLHPNRVVAEAIAAGGVPELVGYPDLRREVKFGARHRLDIELSGPQGLCYVEVKNVTLGAAGVASFPDAVTTRGAGHLAALAEAVARGHRAVIFYLVQRLDCSSFRPADEIDPGYGQALRQAVAAGVEPLVYLARVGPEAIELAERIPLFLPVPPS